MDTPISAQPAPEGAAPPEGAAALALLATLQLADSGFPAGLYAFSHGLETAVQEGRVRTAADLERLATDWLSWAVGPADAVAVGAAATAGAAGDLDTLVAVDLRLAATKLPREGRESSMKSGGRLLATAVSLAPPQGILPAYARAVRAGDAPGTHAAAFGAAAGALGVPPLTAILAELHAATSGLLGAALRLLRVDHQQTQTILRRLAPRLAAIAAGAAAADWRRLQPAAPYLDVLQMRHEGAHVRLFMS
jgi:urease accessory protein